MKKMDEIMDSSETIPAEIVGIKVLEVHFRDLHSDHFLRQVPRKR